MPVHFACPQCRQMLKISRRKIGTICECPRCGNPTAVPAPTTTKRELAHSSSSRLESVPGSAVGLFDEIHELLAQGPVMPAAVGSESNIETRKVLRSPPVDPRWTQPAADLADSPTGKPPRGAARNRLLIQCGLFSIVAATAFAAGYWLGQGRTPTPADTAAAAAPSIPPSAPTSSWPTPTR